MLSLATLFDRHPADRTALVHGDVRWTYGELDERSATFAHWLQCNGVRPDDLVAFALPNGPEFLALTFGIYRAGATPAPLASHLPPSELSAILDIMQPRCFLTQDDLPSSLAQASPSIVPIAKSIKACTSGGSTGRPKVIVDARPAAFPNDADFIGIPKGGVVLIPGPLCHNASFSAAIFALWRDNTVATMSRFNAIEALEVLARERASWALMVPTMMHRIMALPAPDIQRYDLSAWTMVVHTAAAMAPWLKRAWIDRFGTDHIWEVYGATEGIVRCWIGGREWLERPGSTGRPIGGDRVRILSPEGHEVAAGAEGEIFAMPARGPGSTYRYIGAERRQTPDGWESVGDIGRLDDDGYLYLSDRKDDLIISGGINIWPAEVEAALLRHPAIRSCAVYGLPDADRGSVVHALIETDQELALNRLSSFLDQHLIRIKHPRSIECISRPVRDDAGKFRKPRTAAKEQI